MTQFQRIQELLEQNKGILRVGQVLDAGISKKVFYVYAATELEKISHGIYASREAWVDHQYVLHLRCKQGIFSHESALFYHDLTDREPTAFTMTVKTGYNPSALQADGVKVYTVKESLHEIGRTTVTSTFGHPIPIYDRERTICDVLRSRRKIEMQDFRSALRAYAQCKEKDLHRLMQYAPLFGVERILRQYLEVLL